MQINVTLLVVNKIVVKFPLNSAVTAIVDPKELTYTGLEKEQP